MCPAMIISPFVAGWLATAKEITVLSILLTEKICMHYTAGHAVIQLYCQVLGLQSGLL